MRDLGRVPYQEALNVQHSTHARVADGVQPPTLLLVEHDPVITHGRKDGENDFEVVPRETLVRLGIEVIHVERGGSVTYHGPGQIVGYPIFPVGRRVRDFLRQLENALVQALSELGAPARPNPGYAGVYLDAPGPERKIASIGVAVQRGVAFHGFALNVNTNLEHFKLITPCGLEGVTMTSLQEIFGAPQDMTRVKDVLVTAFEQEFAVSRPAEAIA